MANTYGVQFNVLKSVANLVEVIILADLQVVKRFRFRLDHPTLLIVESVRWARRLDLPLEDFANIAHQLDTHIAENKLLSSEVIHNARILLFGAEKGTTS